MASKMTARRRANMTNNNSGIITTGTVGTLTVLTGDYRYQRDQYDNAKSNWNGKPAITDNYSYTVVSTRRSPTTAAISTNVPTLFNQYNAAGVRWKAYAQDLGGGAARGLDELRDRCNPRVVIDTVPGRDDGACGYPGSQDC